MRNDDSGASVVVSPKKQRNRLPFDKRFIGGILIVVLGRELAQYQAMSWLLYVGLAVGGALCLWAVFDALKDM